MPLTVNYIVLGSGYKPSQELEMRFISELLAENFKVHVISIDLLDRPIELPKIPEGIDLKREKMGLNKGNMERVMSLLPPDPSIVIIMDAVQYENADLGKELRDKILQKKHSKFIFCPDVIHYITPDCRDPIFNNGKLDSQFNFDDFHLYKVLHDDTIKNYIKDHKKFQKLEKADVSLSLMKGRKFEMMIGFITSFAFKQYFTDNGIQAEKVVRARLTEYVSQQISLKKIGIDLEFILKKIAEIDSKNLILKRGTLFAPVPEIKALPPASPMSETSEVSEVSDASVAPDASETSESEASESLEASEESEALEASEDPETRATSPLSRAFRSSTPNSSS